MSFVRVGVTFGKRTEEAAVDPPPGDRDVLDGGTVNLVGRDVEVMNTLGWLVISQGGTTGRCVLVVVSWLASTH